MKSEIGTWTLISPTGIQFKAKSPIKCIREERNSRVSPEEALANMNKFWNQCELCEDGKITYILGKRTPAEIRVCTTCKNTILSTIFSKEL